jgi:hypothetical protein
MSNLSGANIGLNFKGLLNLGSTINTPLSATLQAITDGDGVASHLFLSTTEVAVRGTTNAQRLIIDANAGVGKLLSFRSGNLQRWAIRVDGTESGANAGADIAIRRYDDAGTFIDAPITLTRSTGFITLGKRVSYTGSTGTSLLNFPDAGTTAADGISFGTTISLFRSGTNTLFLTDATTLNLTNLRSANTGFITTTLTSLIIGGNTVGGSAATSGLSLTQTWNTTGNPTAIFANITNTASGATSNLMDLQVGGVSQFSVSKAGLTQVRSHLQPIVSNISDLGGSGNRWKDCYFGAVDARRIKNTAAVATDIVVVAKGFTGQTANLFEGQDVSNNVLFSVSPEGAVSSLYSRYGTGSPEGVVTAPIGAFYSCTNGGAGTSFYVKESGTGNTGWTAK